VSLRPRVVLPILVVLAVLVGGGYLAVRAIGRHLPARLPITLQSQICVVDGEYEGQPKVVDLDPEQMANAATIAAVGITRKVPPRAIVVALAAAQQESKLYNLPEGDRDSVGLFQQRPSQGWGTAEQISDPRYAAGRFFTALLKVKNWQSLRIADAAQKVQRSFNGELYQQWAPSAQVMADAFTGTNGRALACTITDQPERRGAAATTALGESLALDWGKVSTSDNATGLAVIVTGDQAGWQYAHWLVAHAAGQSVKSVTFGNQTWTAKQGSWSTRSADPAVAGGAQQVVAEVYSDQ